MRILTAGGGSGGHVTPVVAVLRELKTLHPEAEVRFWCDKGFELQARSILSAYDASIRVDTIVSGKLRRYHTLPWWRQAVRLRTIVWPNVRDGFKVLVGTLQSLVKLLAWRPDVVFTKGGFVCLPIGIAAKLLRIPLVIHDSDAHPGLTNRMLSRWADCILTGAPLEYYSYPAHKSHYVGIPINVALAEPELSIGERRQRLGFDATRPLVVVTGGGLGAERINDVVVTDMSSLLAVSSVAVITGQAHLDDVTNQLADMPSEQLQVHGFISGTMHEYFAAADIVVARAGMTTIAELAALGRPSVLIPNIYLTGGHQLKNAAVYEDAGAAVVVNEQELLEQPGLLAATLTELLSRPERLAELSQAIRRLSKPHAAAETAEIISEVLARGRGDA